MSFTQITKLVQFIQNKLNVTEKDIIIRKFDFDDGAYTIELFSNNKLYEIQHYEPLHMVDNVNYGMGPNYTCYVFDKDKNHFVSC
jgi:hypothetical protein